MVSGYDDKGQIIGKFETRVKVDGNWKTPKDAKKLLKRAGALVIIRENYWENAA